MASPVPTTATAPPLDNLSAKAAPTPQSQSTLVAGFYQMDKIIGQGTYGKVKLATDIRNGQKVSECCAVLISSTTQPCYSSSRPLVRSPSKSWKRPTSRINGKWTVFRGKFDS